MIGLVCLGSHVVREVLTEEMLEVVPPIPVLDFAIFFFIAKSRRL
jgi:hypothetical protein